jgi:hypothetical protein
VQDFQQRYKLLLLRACISNSVLSNCEDDSAAVLLNVLNVAPCPEDPPVRSDESVGESLVLNEHVEALDPKEAQGTVLLYIAGYVAYRFLQAHSCSQCEAALLGAAEDHVPDSMVLMAAKAYRCDVSAHGSLRMPSQRLLNLILYCENIVQANVLHILHMPGICNKLCNSIMESHHPSLMPPMSCPHFHVLKLVQIFIKMRVMYIVHFINTNLAEMPKGKRSLRAIILERM